MVRACVQASTVVPHVMSNDDAILAKGGASCSRIPPQQHTPNSISRKRYLQNTDWPNGWRSCCLSSAVLLYCRTSLSSAVLPYCKTAFPSPPSPMSFLHIPPPFAPLPPHMSHPSPLPSHLSPPPLARLFFSHAPYLKVKLFFPCPLPQSQTFFSHAPYLKVKLHIALEPVDRCPDGQQQQQREGQAGVQQEPGAHARVDNSAVCCQEHEGTWHSSSSSRPA